MHGVGPGRQHEDERRDDRGVGVAGEQVEGRGLDELLALLLHDEVADAKSHLEEWWVTVTVVV